jgi:hypothetical protein
MVTNNYLYLYYFIINQIPRYAEVYLKIYLNPNYEHDFDT